VFVKNFLKYFITKSICLLQFSDFRVIGMKRCGKIKSVDLTAFNGFILKKIKILK